MSGKKKPRRPRRVKPAKPSHKAEAAYREDLLQVCSYIDKVTREILLPVLKRTEPQYAREVKDAAPARATMDGYAADIMLAFDQMAKALGLIDGQAARLAQVAVQRQRVETEVQLARNLTNSLGIDTRGAVASVDVHDEVEAATIANTALIKSIPQQYLEKIKVAVLNDVQQGRRYEQLAEDIEHQMGVTESRAKLIARDQMSKVNSSINEAKQTALGIEKYEWSTSGDERVRESHAAHEGKTFRWDNPPADTGHPGEDVNCRCVAIPVIEFEE
jgi:SPP1 gp7 family putative phage head morphogenesis protein